jgi:cytochrome c biogenesis protein CcmG/thiol:disulfide interchange protein DsbE
MIRLLRSRRWSLAWLLLIVGLAVVLAWLASVPLLRGDSGGRIGSRVGEPAPALSLEDLEGRRWSLDGADGRLVWVNFWATSCEPCRTEMPAMQRLAEVYGDELLILGVDWGEERGGVEDFVARYGVTYPILLDPGLETFYRWSGTDGLPRHYFIGAEGTVLREIVGPLDPARMVAVLEELLAGHVQE